ncbi:MAG: hypothetical protein DHS20C20_33760 [Ardenticatenaceae bacterium]|nr:MAG: hypothetical protein DHS20C20_33760 [Ardenticatenaceae bacterium]
MKIGFRTFLLLCLTFLMIGCTVATATPRPSNDDDDGGFLGNLGDDDFSDEDFVESWEFLPFHGEVHFHLVDAETGAPITNATLQVENLWGSDDEALLADENGRITLHQLERGITYVGDGPPPPTFGFEAPDYSSRQFSVEELAELSGLDPYRDDGLPIVEVVYENGEVDELPLYELTIPLTCATGNCTAVPPPTATAAPTKMPLPTLSPTQTSMPDVADGAITGPNYSFENVSFTLDSTVVPALYPALSENGDQITFLFAKDGYCVIDGCIKMTRVDLAHAWQAELIPDVETAVTNQSAGYQFTNRGAALLLQAKLAYPPAPQVQGVRAVTMHGQDLFVAHNGNIKYEFRGLTTDGTYFVQVYVPLALPFLPDSGDPTQPNQPHFAVPLPETFPSDHTELAVFMHDYNEQVAEILEETAVDVFMPNLTALDSFISSLVIDSDN